MQELIEKYKQEVSSFNSNNEKDIELFRIKYMGKNGFLSKLFNEFKDIEPAKKKRNWLKN